MSDGFSLFSQKFFWGEEGVGGCGECEFISNCLPYQIIASPLRILNLSFAHNHNSLRLARKSD